MRLAPDASHSDLRVSSRSLRPHMEALMGIGGGASSYSRKPNLTSRLLRKLHRLNDAKRPREGLRCPLVRCSAGMPNGYLRGTKEQLGQNNHQSTPIEGHHSDRWYSQNSWLAKVSFVAPSIGLGHVCNSNLVGYRDLMSRTVSARHPRPNRKCREGSRLTVAPTVSPNSPQGCIRRPWVRRSG